jgi:hypothetical protein
VRDLRPLDWDGSAATEVELLVLTDDGIERRALADGTELLHIRGIHPGDCIAVVRRPRPATASRG